PCSGIDPGCGARTRAADRLSLRGDDPGAIRTVMATAYAFGETLLKVDSVSFSHGPTPVLRDLSLEIRNVTRPGLTQGQAVGLLAPSGMGKTPLFRLLAGLAYPRCGTIWVGHPPQRVRRGMVGVVAQNYPLFSHRTVLSNLLVAGGPARLPAQQVQARAR